MSLLKLLGKLQLVKVTKWDDYLSDETESIEERHDTDDITEANVVSSRHASGKRFHAILLDLDVPAYLVPSTTPGHSHLYIDVDVPEARYFELLDLLAECGVIEEPYARISKQKGGTALRLPWVKKERTIEEPKSSDPWSEIW